MAVEQGEVPFERLTDMVHRILRTLFHHGVFDAPSGRRETDYAANGDVALRAAECGIVLLKNRDGILPLSRQARRIAVIGGHADRGVLSGGGSSQVIPIGEPGLELAVGGLAGHFVKVTYHPSSPLRALEAEAPQTQMIFNDGATRLPPPTWRGTVTRRLSLPRNGRRKPRICPILACPTIRTI